MGDADNGMKFPNMNIGNVEINANIDNLTINRKTPRPKPIPIDNPITPEHQLVFKELVDKIVDLCLIIGEYPNKEKGYPRVRGSLNRKLEVTTIKECPDDRFYDGRQYLQKWLWAFITNDKVIKNPPPWWRNYLLAGIHANCSIDDETYRHYLKAKYSVDSSEELDNEKLARLFNYSKQGKFDPSKIKENPRDFDLRINSFSRWLDDMEQVGDFDRMNIRLLKPDILALLQQRDRTLWSMAFSTFETFWKNAKKHISFEQKTGRRHK